MDAELEVEDNIYRRITNESKAQELKEQIAKSREDLKAAFDSQEDGKYTPEAKEKIKGLNTELAGLVDDLKVEEAKVSNEKALEAEKSL